MNTCDHGHETNNEIRALPLGTNTAHGNILICHQHYIIEMRYRRDREKETGPGSWEFPAWEALTVYAPE